MWVQVHLGEPSLHLSHPWRGGTKFPFFFLKCWSYIIVICISIIYFVLSKAHYSYYIFFSLPWPCSMWQFILFLTHFHQFLGETTPNLFFVWLELSPKGIQFMQFIALSWHCKAPKFQFYIQAYMEIVYEQNWKIICQKGEKSNTLLQTHFYSTNLLVITFAFYLCK